MRLESDVQLALRDRPGRAGDGWPERYGARRGSGNVPRYWVSIRRVHPGGAARRNSSRAGGVWQPAPLATHPKGWDASGFFVGRVGTAVR